MLTPPGCISSVSFTKYNWLVILIFFLHLYTLESVFIPMMDIHFATNITVWSYFLFEHPLWLTCVCAQQIYKNKAAYLLAKNLEFPPSHYSRIFKLYKGGWYLDDVSFVFEGFRVCIIYCLNVLCFLGKGPPNLMLQNVDEDLRFLPW